MGEMFAGRYELVDPIGRGGVGMVWRVWDHRRRAYVAAKVLRQSDAHTLLRFVREQALRIDHPHVLAPRSWAADDEQVLFTMELVRGGSLAHLVGDYGSLAPEYACTLLDQLLSGLAAVHEEDVVHRDVKPANILLETTGTARPHLRLSDFGIAMRKGEPRLTRTDHVVGTPGYVAPEQLLGAEPDFPADLYAVGLVALYLLTGRKPDSEALVERFASHGGGIPAPPREVPEPLWEVVATLLQPRPDARFRSATGARKALARAAELLPAPEVDDEAIEVIDQIGPLPAGYGPQGPLRPRPGPAILGPAPAPPTLPPFPPALSPTGDFPLAPPRPAPGTPIPEGTPAGAPSGAASATGAPAGAGTGSGTPSGGWSRPAPPMPAIPPPPPHAPAPARAVAPAPYVPGPPAAEGAVPVLPAPAPVAVRPATGRAPYDGAAAPGSSAGASGGASAGTSAGAPAGASAEDGAAAGGAGSAVRDGPAHAGAAGRGRPRTAVVVGMYLAAVVLLAFGVWALSGG